MLKKRILLLIVLISACFLFAIPIKFAHNSIQKAIAIKKLRSFTKQITHGVEYITFEDLNLDTYHTINNNKYFINASIKKTQNLANLYRSNSNETLLENAEFEGVSGTVHNMQTQDIYYIQSQFLHVADGTNLIKLFGNFSIKIKTSKDEDEYIMNGENLTFNLKQKKAESRKPVLFTTEDSFLSANNFLYQNNKITMEGNIIVDTPEMKITSQKMEVNIEEKSPKLNNKINFEQIIFSKNPIFFDKKSNIYAYGEKIIFNNKKKIAFLKNKAMIKSDQGIIKGENMEYVIKEGFAKVESNKSKIENNLVEINFKY